MVEGGGEKGWWRKFGGREEGRRDIEEGGKWREVDGGNFLKNNGSVE